MEEFHPENGESPFIVKDDPDKKDSADKSPDEDNFAMCSVEGCGEVILLAELDNHIELHALEDAGSTPEVKSNQASIKETPTSSLAASIHSVGTQLSKQEKAIASWKELFHMPDKSSSKGDKPQYDVCLYFPPMICKILKTLRNHNLVLMQMRIKCQTGFVKFLRTMVVKNRVPELVLMARLGKSWPLRIRLKAYYL